MKNPCFISLVAAAALLATIACGWIKTKPPPLESEQADSSPVAPFTPFALRLNSQELGTTADLRELRSMVGDIMTAREQNGVFREGSNAIENRIFLEVDPKVPIGVLADIVLAVNENGGEVRFALPGAMRDSKGLELSAPNPLTLILEAGVAHNYVEAPLYRLYEQGNERFTTAPNFVVTNSVPEIVIARAMNGSLEISASGDYFVNERADLENSKSPDDVTIVQRRLTDQAIKSEGLRLSSTSGIRDQLTAVVSESARSDRLLSLFAVFEGTDVRWQIYVRKPAKTKS